MIVLNEGSMDAKTAGPLRDPDLLIPPPPYQQVDVRRGGPSTQARDASLLTASGGPSTSISSSTLAPSPAPRSLAPSPSPSTNPYLSVPSHRRDFSVGSSRSLSPYAASSYSDFLARSSSSPALASSTGSPTSPISAAEFAARQDPSTRPSRGFKLPTSSDGLAALLSPPPPSFERPRAADVPYTPFKPTSLLGISTDLTRSFPRMAPPCASGAEHPFATHDVTEEDWSRFLRDVEAAGQLSKWERIMTRVSLPSLIGLSVGLVVKGIEVYMHNRRRGPVGELIGYWNHHFFHPRHMHIVLARGSKAYSGSDPHPPDLPAMPEDEPESERSRKLKEFEAECPKYWRLVVAYRSR
ncbi:uncharacterized protein C8Q71DRAFT_120981 [Rhodofomes roseus]|uniref:Uncharacterized protein n=1 Tax=Rhodofomes roseus TaxID=34475 RepID=A0ABQ8KCZ1_9APHY|nr:uncharacterized protein C8Q71DRAFT_120981 [Rhodofomes roseus]KAH9835463.1 hypothetical protein C8Q71DRAFT_120981 [Rhodofomes roseus]